MPPRSRSLGIVAPSSYMPDPLVVDRAAKFFSARGWQVQAGETCFAKHERFAGPDEVRAAEFQRFCTDPTLDVVLAARGGYGLSRLLGRLDYEAIRKANKVICGYSDFTAFNLAYLAQAGGISFQGPSAGDFGSMTPDPFTIEQFFAAIDHPEHTLEFETDGPATEVRGTLWGGNLALLTALVGTPYLPKIRGGILFIEDVNEPAYRIERMLYQLLHAGVLGKQKALVVGDFDPVTPMPNDNGFSVAAALKQIGAAIEAPIVTGLPFGHVVTKATLPVGATATLTVRAGRARLATERPAGG